MINASDKTEPAGPSPYPHIAPAISSTSVFAQIRTRHPRSHRASEFMSAAVAPRVAEMYITGMTVSPRDIDIEKKIFLASGEITFLSTRETHVSVNIRTDDAG